MAQRPLLGGDLGPIFTPLQIDSPFSHIPANQFGPSVKNVTRGSIIAFNYPQSMAVYPNIIHDHYPLIIVADVWDKYIRGVNLHYLTFPFIRYLLAPNCDNPQFSYFNIKGNKYLSDSFRTYVRLGIKKPKKLDCGVLLRIISGLRAYTEEEKEGMKNYIKEIIQRQMTPRPPRPGSFEYSGSILGGLERGITAPTPEAPGP